MFITLSTANILQMNMCIIIIYIYIVESFYDSLLFLFRYLEEPFFFHFRLSLSRADFNQK
jgi:hypothetical protein